MASQLLTIDGLVVRIWKNTRGAKIPPRGFLWINHGLGEHADRYNSVAIFMASFGWDVIAPDLPGHGLTKIHGIYPKLLSPQETLPLLNNLAVSLSRESQLSEGSAFIKSPKVLVGHSMGALISALWLCAETSNIMTGFEWKSAFLSAPPMRLHMKVPEWKLGLAKLLEKVAPDLKIGNEISASQLSVDATNQAEYKSDELVHGYASPRLFWGIRRAAEHVMKHAKMIEVPLCLAVAKNDPIVDSGAVREFFDAINTHKKFLEFPLSKHEIFNDVEKRLVFDALLKWSAQ
jgi:alpha-beta hydrolase superfamily lysophospholipase